MSDLMFEFAGDEYRWWYTSSPEVHSFKINAYVYYRYHREIIIMSTYNRFKLPLGVIRIAYDDSSHDSHYNDFCDKIYNAMFHLLTN